MALADARRTADQQVVVSGHEGTGGQVHHHRPVQAGHRGEVEAGEGLRLLASGLLQPDSQPALIPPLQFVVQQQRQELPWRQTILDCLRRSDLQTVQHPRELQFLQLRQERVDWTAVHRCSHRVASSVPKNSETGLAKANWRASLRCCKVAKGTSSGGKGSRSRAAFRISLIRRYRPSP